jgi:predicted nuclease of predicted toxin-antitoxin system
VLLTNDLDFSAIMAASGGVLPSIIQLRAGDLTPESIGAATLVAIKKCDAQLAAGALVTIGRTRVRILPIR